MELEGNLRSEIQKWRGEAETVERKLRSSQEEHKHVSQKLKNLQDEYDNFQKSYAQRASHMS
jgi:peptidoglycan hydrolase CwlO-like protein